MFDVPDYKLAHPKAKALLDEPFYFSPIEESAPFGSDDGSDAFMAFQEWRSSNQQESPLTFLEELLHEWRYPPFNLLEMDQLAIDTYSRDNEFGVPALVGMDAAILAVAFGQLYLEGTIDAPLKELAMISVRRQLHPEFLQLWDAEYAPLREEQLGKVISVLGRVDG